MAGRTAVTRKDDSHPGLLDDPEYAYSGPQPYRSMLGAPVLVEDDLIGVVNLVRQEPRPFTDDQIALLETFANQAAIAIANSRLTAAPEELFEVLRAYHETLGELIPAYHGTLEHFAGDGWCFSTTRSLSKITSCSGPACAGRPGALRRAGARMAKAGTELGLGIGIEAGYATLGRIGFEGRYDYGALGPRAVPLRSAATEL
jgi:hypothetical protein